MQQAGEIQEETGTIEIRKLVKDGMLEDPDQYWAVTDKLTNKFEPLKNFAKEQAYFELKKQTLKERKSVLSN